MSFGGFLGIGSNLLAVPWVLLSYNRKLDAYQLDINDEDLQSAPSFTEKRDFDWGDRSQEEALHRHYGVAPYWGEF